MDPRAESAFSRNKNKGTIKSKLNYDPNTGLTEKNYDYSIDPKSSVFLWEDGVMYAYSNDNSYHSSGKGMTPEFSFILDILGTYFGGKN